MKNKRFFIWIVILLGWFIPVYAEELTGDTSIDVNIWWKNFDNVSSMKGEVALYYNGYQNGEVPFKTMEVAYDTTRSLSEATFTSLPGEKGDYKAELITIHGESTKTLLETHPNWIFSTMIDQYTEEEGYKKANVINYYGEDKMIFQVDAGSATYPLYLHKIFMNQVGENWVKRATIPQGKYRFAIYKVSSFTNGICSCEADTPRATKEITIDSTNDNADALNLTFYVPTDGGTYHIHEIDDEGNIIHGGNYSSSAPENITLGDIAIVNGKKSYVVYRTDNGGGHFETDTAQVTNYIVGGSLKISTLTEETIDKDKEFSYEIKLSDSSINGTFKDVEIQNGIGHFQMKINEVVEIEGLPDGVDYTVTELTTGYIVTKSNTDDVIASDEIKEATFIYKKNENPSTFHNSMIIFSIILIGGIFLLAFVYPNIKLLKKRRNNG